MARLALAMYECTYKKMIYWKLKLDEWYWAKIYLHTIKKLARKMPGFAPFSATKESRYIFSAVWKWSIGIFFRKPQTVIYLVDAVTNSERTVIVAIRTHVRYVHK